MNDLERIVTIVSLVAAILGGLVVAFEHALNWYERWLVPRCRRWRVHLRRWRWAVLRAWVRWVRWRRK